MTAEDNFDDLRARLGKIIRDHGKEAPAAAETAVRGNGNIVNSTIIVKVPAAARPERARANWPARRRMVAVLLEAIRERAALLAMTEEQVVEVATKEIRERPVVLSLDGLEERELGRVYAALTKLWRPGLE